MDEGKTRVSGLVSTKVSAYTFFVEGEGEMVVSMRCGWAHDMACTITEVK